MEARQMRALNPAWDEPFGGSVTEVPRLTTACACLVCGGGATTREYFIPPSSGTASNGKTIYSWDEAAAQLTRGGYTWSSTLGGAVTVTYGFRSTAPSNMPDDTGGFSRFNESQIIATIEALALWSDVANITFVRVGSGTTGEGAYTNSATMLFANYSTGVEGAAAFAYLPSPGATGSNSSAGDVWVNVSQSANANPVFGDYGPHTLAHEIGHAIGLRHPSDYDGGSPTYGANAAYWQDARMFTIMSYFGSSNTGGSLPIFSVGPQLHDIAAAQRLYGPNMTTRTGNTTYGFNSNTGHEHTTITSSTAGAVFAIWDAGGIDTLDLSGYDTPSEIDLREEAFSGAGPGNGGGVAVGNISIARGAVIENAVGGAGNDTIIGNQVANVLIGGLGNDAINGNEGNDELIGASGGDALNGGPDGDTASYRSASAGVTLNLDTGGTGGDAAGDTYASIEQIYGSDYSDNITGSNQLDDQLYGFSGNDVLGGGAGADLLEGGPGADTLDGGADGDTASYRLSTAGVSLYLQTGGTAGDAAGDQYVSIEQVYGSDYNDQIVGSASTDSLLGFGGADILDGAEGDDVLYGGDGADQFIGGPGFDSVSYALASAGVSLDLATGGTAGEALGDTFSSIEQLYGSSFADNIAGSAASDQLFGFGGDDRIDGGVGNDILYGGVGADELDGGADFDIVSYYYAAAAVALNLTTGGTGGEASGDTFVNIEMIYGSVFGDSIAGSAAADQLAGFEGDDTLNGGAGNDILYGGAGADALNGGSDFDIASYYYSNGEVTVDLSAQGSGNEAAGDTFVSIEMVYGSQFGDTIRGAGGNDQLAGFAGNDQIFGNSGNDILLGGEGADTLDGGDGIDIASYYYASGSGVSVNLAAGSGSGGDAQGDVLVSIEQVYGSRNGDSLTGSSGDNLIAGFDGQDVIDGGAGTDMLYGGADADRFVVMSGSGADTIMDFEDGLDLIDLRGYAGATFANTMVAAAGADVLLTFFGGETALLKNMLAANITDADFLFS
jgi:serralysin